MGSQIYWIPPVGEQVNLNDHQKFWAVRGWKNFHNLPFEINSYEVPLRAGEAFSSVEIKPRDIDLPILIVSSSRYQFMQDYRSLVSAFNPTLGEGIIRHISVDGLVRDLHCRYRSGLQGATDGIGWSPGSALVVLTLRASDPFWYQSQSVDLTFSSSPPVAFFPFFPLKFTQGTIFNTSGNILINPGEATAWPIWTIVGPGTVLKLANLRTGYSLQAALNLESAQSVIIDTRPGIKTVLREDGSNMFPTLTNASLLWGLEPGENDISVILDGSTSESSVSVSYHAPYLGI